MSDVTRNDDANRFELDEGGHLAVLTFGRGEDSITLVHTEVPEEMAGGGVGGRLVRAAVADAAAHDLAVIPLCPFAREWLQRHPDVAATVDVRW